MKKLSVIFICIMMLLTGCKEGVTPVEPVSHEIMGNNEINIPEGTPALTRAVFIATDYVVNKAVNTQLKKKPEFISFEFSGNTLLSLEERDTLMTLFQVYGVEITQGLRNDLAEIEKGITVGYDSIQETQLEDCDLTIPVRVYYGKSYYTYCCDFKLEKGAYVMFRTEFLHRNPYIW